MPGNNRVNFLQQADSRYKTSEAPSFGGSKFVQVDSTTWELRFDKGATWRFRPYSGITGVQRGGPPFFLDQITGRDGNTLTIARNTVGRITTIGSSGRFLTMSYGGNGFVSSMADPMGRTVKAKPSRIRYAKCYRRLKN